MGRFPPRPGLPRRASFLDFYYCNQAEKKGGRAVYVVANPVVGWMSLFYVSG